MRTRPSSGGLRLVAVLTVPFVLALGGCGGGSARDIEKLLGDVASASPRARARAERSLAEHGRTLIKPLSSILTGEEVEKLGLRGDWHALRAPAAQALGLIAAKASLARSEAEVAAKPLLTVLNGKETPFRIEAAKALGYFAQLSAPANDLVLVLREEDQGLADAAIGALARNALRSIERLAPPEEPPPTAAVKKDWDRLLLRLGSTDDDIRLETVRELAATRDPRAAPLLLDRLAKDTSNDVRYAALRYCVAAAEAGADAAGAARLYEQLAASYAKDGDSRIALLAAQVLRKRKAELVGAFLARVEAARRQCEARLLADAASSDYDAATRADAIAALGALPGDTRDALLARLLSRSAGEAVRIRRAAASVLASSSSSGAADALRGAMRDDDSIVKLVAAQALGRRGDLDAVNYLIDLLSHKEAKIRTPAADALGTLGAKARDLLVEQLDKSLANAKELAQWEVPLLALKRKPEPASQDRSEIARLEAAVAAFKRKTPGRGEKDVAWGIVSGLGHIAAEIGPEADPALDAIVRAAQCHYVDVRRAAVNALASFHGAKPLRVLVAALKDPDDSVRWYAATGIEKQGDAAISDLTAALDDPAVAAIAASSLARVGGPEALQPLLAHLDAAKGATKAALAWSIGELLARHPGSSYAAAARRALSAACELTGDPETARTARYALAKSTPKPAPPK